jgi:hypothetical protein
MERNLEVPVVSHFHVNKTLHNQVSKKSSSNLEAPIGESLGRLKKIFFMQSIVK